MCFLLITRLLRGVGSWARKPVNHTSWVAVVTPTDRPKSVRSCCLIELLCNVVCVVVLPFWHFCWCRGFCHRTGSDLLLFVFFSICHLTCDIFYDLLLHGVYTFSVLIFLQYVKNAQLVVKAQLNRQINIARKIKTGYMYWSGVCHGWFYLYPFTPLISPWSWSFLHLYQRYMWIIFHYFFGKTIHVY